MQPRAEVSRRIRASLPAVVDDVVAVVREQVPAYAALTGAQRDEVTAIARWAVERVLDLWVDDDELTEADVRRFRGIGAARALDGRPLPGVLRAYRVGAARMTDLVADLGVDVLTAADALALARLWMGALDLLSEAVYAGHTRATDRVGDREVALGDLLADIVSGRQSVRTALADRCRELGVVLPPRPVVLVTTGAAPAHALLATPYDGHLVALLGPPRAAPATDPSPDRTRDHGERACTVTAHGVADVPRAHRLADLAVAHAPTHACGPRVLDEGDAQVLAALRGHRDADPLRLVSGVLASAADQPDLLATLDAHLETGTATDAARVLDVHAQTVRHRLRRLTQLTGRRVGTPWDRFTLQAARA